MDKSNTIKNIIILIALGLLCSGTASAALIDTTSLGATVTPSQIVINGATPANGTVEIRTEFSTNVTVAGNTFEYEKNDYAVPDLSGDETLTISTYPVNSNSNLTVGKTIWIWNIDIKNTVFPAPVLNNSAYTSPNFNKTAGYINDKFFGTGNFANLLVGVKINIRVNGTSNAPEVTIKFIGTRTITANGSFSTAFSTAGFPDGTYTITSNNGDNLTVNKTVVTLPYTAPPAPPSGGGGGGGTPLTIIPGDDGIVATDEGTTTEDSGETGETGEAPDEGGADSADSGESEDAGEETTFQTEEPAPGGLLNELFALLGIGNSGESGDAGEETTFQTEESESGGLFNALGKILLVLLAMLGIAYAVRRYRQ